MSISGLLFYFFGGISVFLSVTQASQVSCNTLKKTAELCQKYLVKYEEETKKIRSEYDNSLRDIEFLKDSSDPSQYLSFQSKIEKRKEDNLIDAKGTLKENFSIIVLGSDGYKSLKNCPEMTSIVGKCFIAYYKIIPPMRVDHDPYRPAVR